MTISRTEKYCPNIFKHAWPVAEEFSVLLRKITRYLDTGKGDISGVRPSKQLNLPLTGRFFFCFAMNDALARKYPFVTIHNRERDQLCCENHHTYKNDAFTARINTIIPRNNFRWFLIKLLEESHKKTPDRTRKKS